MNRVNILKRLEMAENRKRSGISEEAIEEVAAYMEENREKYEEESRAFYEEVKKTAALREAAAKRGEDIRNYPMPWETIESLEKDIKENKEWTEIFRSMGLDVRNMLKVQERLEKELEERILFERGKEA